ncbi:MAG TPA: RsmE family RNA methyltransferase [Bryobacteraceae bacterium]
MARRRFFVDEIRQGRAVLAGEEARHLRQVLRAEEGQRYELCDNRAVYLAEIDAVRKDEVRFRVIEELAAEAPPVRLTLLLALIKFDRFEWAVEKATELGVETIVPVAAERSEKGLDRAAGKRLERWRRIARESSQQSRRARVPDVAEPVRLAGALSEPGYFLDEEGGQPLAAAFPAARAQDDCVRILIGPEGGWTEAERRLAREAGWKPVWLGPAILRAETAAVAAAAVVMNAWLASVQSGQSVGSAVETSSESS